MSLTGGSAGGPIRPVGAGGERAGVGSGEPTIVEFLSLVLRHRRLLLGSAGLLAALVVLVTLLRPRTFTTTATFLPHVSAEQRSRLASVAAQFGFALPAADPGQSPDFYVNLLESAHILGSVVEQLYTLPARDEGSGPVSGTLIELLEVRGATETVRREAAIRRLRGMLTARAQRETGMVEMEVRTRWPTMAAAITERLLEAVNSFNLQTRQSQAAAERRFIETRLAEARIEQRRTEDSLQAFLQRNRQFASSPQLVFEHDRLQREVSLRQQVVVALAQSYEQARIDEVRNTPVITVVQRPVVPALPDRRRLASKALVGVVLGGLLGLFVAFGRELVRQTRVKDPERFAELVQLMEAVRSDLRRPWRVVRSSD